MERYYLFVRPWNNFDRNFPFDKFNDLPDDEINGALELYAVEYGKAHKAELNRLARKEKAELAAAIKKKREQATARAGWNPARPPSKTESQPADKCSRGCRIAHLKGWVHTKLHAFGGKFDDALSPSKKLFLVMVEGEELAAEILKALVAWWPNTNLAHDFPRLLPRFGCLPGSKFGMEEQTTIELQIQNMFENEPGFPTEAIQQAAAKEARMVGDKVIELLKRRNGPKDSQDVDGNDASIPTATPSGKDDIQPDDLMYLSVVKQNYIISQSSLDRDIRSGKLKAWRKKPRAKRKVSKTACDLIYNAKKR